MSIESMDLNMSFTAEDKVKDGESNLFQNANCSQSQSETSDVLMLTVKEAATILGRSVRALERSLLGRWGNKLPEGWSAKRITTEKGEEWRLIPPAGFKLHSVLTTAQTSSENNQTDKELSELEFSLDYLVQQSQSKRFFKHENGRSEQTTIVIDRSEEVENLLRELLASQKTLSEERRLRMEDMRIMSQMQSSMRLLETGAGENKELKQQLELRSKELNDLQTKYEAVIALPWWKRLFGFSAVKIDK